MNATKNYLLLLLSAVCIALAVFLWRQHQELTGLRVAALNGSERAEWQKRLWEAEKRRASLEQKVTELESREPTEPAEPPPPAGGDAAERRGNSRRGDRAAEFMAVMDKPEVQRLLALQQKGALDGRYAALFRGLNLTPDQLDKFKNLLVEKQTSIMDVLAAARAQGINPRSDPAAFRQMMSDAQGEIDGSIKTLLGEVGFSQYQNYEKTLPQRNTIGQLEQRLSYTSTPLTAAQSEQMVSILAATSPGRSGESTAFRGALFNAGAGGPVQALVGGGTARVTDAAVTQAQGVLAAPQLEALKQLQEEQAAQAKLARTMRTQFGVPGSPPGSPPPGGSPPATNPKPGGG